MQSWWGGSSIDCNCNFVHIWSAILRAHGHFVAQNWTKHTKRQAQHFANSIPRRHYHDHGWSCCCRPEIGSIHQLGRFGIFLSSRYVSLRLFTNGFVHHCNSLSRSFGSCCCRDGFPLSRQWSGRGQLDFVQKYIPRNILGAGANCWLRGQHERDLGVVCVECIWI